MEQRFRKDYPGEFVILENRWINGRKEQTREWIDNPIQNHHISGRAVVIGSAVDKEFFDYTRLQKHRGGLLGKKRLQTYVAGNIWKELIADFVVETNDAGLAEIIDANYAEQNIVYTTARNCIKYPGEFYLIPFAPRIDILALPIYLAAFDGHEEIFLLGYSNETTSGDRNWHSHIYTLIGAYPGVKFYFVGTESNVPAAWRQRVNVSCMTYREFVSYCDV
jgi:hypothetical protein